MHVQLLPNLFFHFFIHGYRIDQLHAFEMFLRAFIVTDLGTRAAGQSFHFHDIEAGRRAGRGFRVIRIHAEFRNRIAPEEMMGLRNADAICMRPVSLVMMSFDLLTRSADSLILNLPQAL